MFFQFTNFDSLARLGLEGPALVEYSLTDSEQTYSPWLQLNWVNSPDT